MSIRYSLTRLLRAGASALFWTICSVGWPGVSEAAVDSLPYVDLRTYGVKANDPASNTSNTSAVKQALSDFASTGAELHFPSGTIFLDQDTVASPSSFKNSITVLGHDLVLSGEGMFATTLVAQGAGSTIPSQGWCLIEVANGAKRVEIKDLALKQGTITNPPDQDHGHVLQISNTNSSSPTQDIYIHDVFFGAAIGDGIRIVGNPPSSLVDTVRILNLTMHTGGHPSFPLGSRSGISFQRGYNGVEVGSFYIDGPKNSPIDFEPSGNLQQTHFNIHDGIVNNALGSTFIAASFDGSKGGTTLAQRSQVHNVTVLEGQVQFINTDHLDVSDLKVYDSSSGPTDATTAGQLVYVYQTNVDLTLRDLDLQKLSGAQTGPLMIIRGEKVKMPGSDESVLKYPQRVTVEGGRFLQQTDQDVFDISSCDQCTVSGANIRWEGPTPASWQAFILRSGLVSMTNTLLANIKLAPPPFGRLKYVIWAAADPQTSIDDLTIVNIEAPEAATTGVLFDAAVDGIFDRSPILQGCDFKHATVTWATDHAANNRVFPIVAGSNSSLTARHLEGTVAPNEVVFGNLGDIYTFRPTPTSAQIWFKATQSGGPNSNTGWVQK